MTYNTLIDVAALGSLMTEGEPKGEPVIIDCRFDLMQPDAGRAAYLSGHIPGARYADLNHDLAASVMPHTGRHPLPRADEFAAVLTRLGVANHSQVVAYDDGNGAFAARLWWMLRWLGHDAVAVLDGGVAAWRADGRPLQTGEFASAAADGAAAAAFVPHPRPEMTVDVQGVLALLTDTSQALVDARAAPRFAGTVEPIDPVAGHVPGALNHPFTDNLRPDGRWLDPADLRQRWQQRLGSRAPARVVAMCGSGVTACHNLLSLEVAGLSGARLYPGSWSEWIRDPGRPVAP